jgi:DNA-binding response OmpR family regulator
MSPERLTGNRSPRVLLAEDDGNESRRLFWALDKAGYKVTECRSSIELIDYLRSDSEVKPCCDLDIIVTDLPMPMAEQFEFLDALDLRRGRPPVILIVECLDERTRARARQAGIAATIQKQCRIDEFLRLVDRFTPA